MAEADIAGRFALPAVAGGLPADENTLPAVDGLLPAVTPSLSALEAVLPAMSKKSKSTAK